MWRRKVLVQYYGWEETICAIFMSMVSECLRVLLRNACLSIPVLERTRRR